LAHFFDAHDLTDRLAHPDTHFRTFGSVAPNLLRLIGNMLYGSVQSLRPAVPSTQASTDKPLFATSQLLDAVSPE
jgi:hypothetical protein